MSFEIVFGYIALRLLNRWSVKWLFKNFQYLGIYRRDQIFTKFLIKWFVFRIWILNSGINVSLELLIVEAIIFDALEFNEIFEI